MIVVTGLGRSGTSLVAALYRDLGFDPGGEWSPEMRAGLEDPEVVRLNERLIKSLGIGVHERDLPPRLRRAWEASPTAVRDTVRTGLQSTPEIFGRRLALRWDRLPTVVERARDRLREAAAARSVVKDPRFCWTLGVWAAADAPIDHVVVCFRDLDGVMGSWQRVGMRHVASAQRRKSELVYRLGLLMASIHEHALPYTVVRFPQLLDAPEDLYEALRFPEPVSRDRFMRSFRSLTEDDGP